MVDETNAGNELATGKITDTELARVDELLQRIRQIFRGRVVGQDGLYTALVTALMAQGHVLLESVPGLAKTTAATTLADAISGTFSRIQCTPDLMPNDIVGTQIYSYESGQFSTQLGPVHANVVLLDEINRSSAKTQSAMLEAMQERQTSIGGTIYKLPAPFMVLATQNPIEEEGTYVLPEAQMDRFLIKEVLSYPLPSEEIEILTRTAQGTFGRPAGVEPISTEDIMFLQAMSQKVYVDSAIKSYIVALINTTRGGGRGPSRALRRRCGWALHRVAVSPSCRWVRRSHCRRGETTLCPTTSRRCVTPCSGIGLCAPTMPSRMMSPPSLWWMPCSRRFPLRNGGGGGG